MSLTRVAGGRAAFALDDEPATSVCGAVRNESDAVVGAVGVTANSHVLHTVVDVVPPARLYWLPSQIRPTLPLPAAGSGLAPE